MIGLNLFSSLDQVHYIQITSYFCCDIKFFAVMMLITWNNLYKYPFSNTVFNFSNVFFSLEINAKVFISVCFIVPVKEMKAFGKSLQVARYLS